MSYLIDYIEQILTWLLDFALWVPRMIWEALLDGLASALEAIPVPEWLSESTGLFASIDPGIAYFADALMIPQGLGIILGAYVVRFLIRRIPVVG